MNEKVPACLEVYCSMSEGPAKNRLGSLTELEPAPAERGALPSTQEVLADKRRPESPSDIFEESRQSWRQLTRYQHSVAVLLLILLSLLRWPASVSNHPRGDEKVYLAGFTEVLNGDSPYTVRGFYYPPGFARLGAWVLDWGGQVGVLFALRLANHVGICLVIWLAMSWLPLRLGQRWLVGALVLCLSPAIHGGIVWGNVSFAAIALVIFGLQCWEKSVLLAGLLLGVGLAVKPLAPGALAVLVAHRPQDVRSRPMRVVAVAIVVGAVGMLPLSQLRQMLALSPGSLAYSRSVSLQRFLATLGLEVPHSATAVLVLVLVMALAYRRNLSSVQLECLAIAAITLATPIVWGHTLMITLPIQAMASCAALMRYRAHGRLREPIFVALAILMIHCGRAAGIDGLAHYLQALLLAFPVLTPTLLAGYVVWVASRRQPTVSAVETSAEG